MFESIDDLRLDVEDLAEVGDRLWVRATMTGRHTGPLFGVPGTGRSISQSVMTTLRFVDGRCVERWSVADTLAVLVQIGAVSPPT
jgi:predicted ester cyclase